MNSRRLTFTVSAVFFFAIASYCQKGHAANEVNQLSFKPVSPFSTALETLQNKIGYNFRSLGLLRRAMTHASFSEENNRALSVLGADVIQTSVCLKLLGMVADISPEELNRRISEISNVESSCLVDGMRLGLQEVVRISTKVNSSAPHVLCGAFRAIFGAIAIDTGKSDDAGKVFLSVHGGDVVGAIAM